MTGKRCSLGKSCGATCIDAAERCNLELGPEIQKSLPKVVNIVEAVQGKLDEAIKLDKPITTEAEAVENLKKYWSKMLTGGMEDRFYGGPGQRGDTKAKFWLLGQEAYADDKYNPKTKENDPVALVNSLRLHNKLYEVAKREVDGKQNVTSGVEDFLAGRAFNLDKHTTVENWVKDKGTTYYGRLGRLANGLGYSGDVLGANVSSFLQPAGQKGLGEISKMLTRNGVDVNTFANGAFRNKEAWYNASADARLPIMLKGIKRYKPEVVYIGEQKAPDAKSFSNMVMYKLSKATGLPVQHLTFNGFDYKYIVMPLPGGNKTVIMNAWHPTGLKGAKVKGEGAVKTQEEFLKGLLQSLKTTGKAPQGLTVNTVDKATMDKVLGEKVAKVAKVAKAKVSPVKETPKVAPKATPKAAGKTAQQAAYQTIVNGLRSNGKSDVFIRDYLRGMKVPPALINEMV